MQQLIFRLFVGGSVANGVGSGFWWSAVTMLRVGGGDKVPVITTGRVPATVLMFFSVTTISGFTAAITSSVTVHLLDTVARGLNDLVRVRCVAVAGYTGEQFLQKQGIHARAVATAGEGQALLGEGRADALVYDEPLLRYLLRMPPLVPRSCRSPSSGSTTPSA